MKKMCCLILAAVIGIGCVIGFSFSGAEPLEAATTQEKLEAAKEKLNEAREQIKDIKDRLAEIGSNKEELFAKKNLLDEQIAATEAQIATINSALEVIEKELEVKTAELAVVQDKYDETMVKFRSRARASYESGTQSYLEAILTSTDLSQLLTKLDLVEAVAEYDSQLLNDLAAQAEEKKILVDEIEERKNMKTAELEEQAEAEAELISRKSELQTTLSRLTADAEELEAQEQAWTEKEAEFEKEIAKLADTSASYYGDEFCWPVPASSYVSSGFGWRTYTYNGKVITGFHHAIDIAAATGTKVVAAGDGTVLRAGWVTTGGGNQVVVDHGSRLLTYYNHLSGFAVSAGTKVKRGQVIAYVGMSGTATGPHLDFAIMYKGSYQNPSLYVNYRNAKPAKSIKDLIAS